MEKTSLKLNNFDDFADACRYFGIEVSNNQLILFKKYYEILLDWNKKINLISRKDTSLSTILEKHFLDSIIFLSEIEELGQQSVVSGQWSVFDIGSGGGFPGIPLAILRPNWSFILCESTEKKAKFLNGLVKELKLDRYIKVLNKRVEEINKQKDFQSKYDIVTARAVGKVNELINYGLPLLKTGGHLICYKAKDIEGEINIAEKLITKHKLHLSMYSKDINSINRKLIALRK